MASKKKNNLQELEVNVAQMLNVWYIYIIYLHLAHLA